MARNGFCDRKPFLNVSQTVLLRRYWIRWGDWLAPS